MISRLLTTVGLAPYSYYAINANNKNNRVELEVQGEDSVNTEAAVNLNSFEISKLSQVNYNLALA